MCQSGLHTCTSLFQHAPLLDKAGFTPASSLFQHAPSFDKVAYELEVPEDVSGGTEVARVRAVDPDRGQYGQITYSIPSDSWREVFAINASTGERDLGPGVCCQLLFA